MVRPARLRSDGEDVGVAKGGQAAEIHCAKLRRTDSTAFKAHTHVIHVNICKHINILYTITSATIYMLHGYSYVYIIISFIDYGVYIDEHYRPYICDKLWV